jgi:midasin (ATPase involved in ribosome maturation)
MIQINPKTATNDELRAYIGTFSGEQIIDAARAQGWKFSRGRPSAEALINIWSASYPHWLQRIASWFIITGTVPSMPASKPAPATIPNDWIDTPPAPSVDIHSALEPIRETIERIGENVERFGANADYAHRIATAVRNELHASISALREEITRQAPIQITINNVTLPPISGQHYKFPELVRWLSQGENVILVGPAGTGKTTAAFEYAKLRGLTLYSQPQTMDAFGVFGFIDAKGEIVETEFSRAWKNGGVFLWDEISISSGDAVGALNAALANRYAPLPGIGTIPAHPDFVCIVGDNSDTGASVKYSARNLLDGASLDRFVKIEWDIDPIIETCMASGHDDWLACVRAVRAFIDAREIAHVGATPRAVLQGAKALTAGNLTREQILTATLKKGILAESWAEVLRLPEVEAFLAGSII